MTNEMRLSVGLRSVLEVALAAIPGAALACVQVFSGERLRIAALLDAAGLALAPDEPAPETLLAELDPTAELTLLPADQWYVAFLPARYLPAMHRSKVMVLAPLCWAGRLEGYLAVDYPAGELAPATRQLLLLLANHSALLLERQRLYLNAAQTAQHVRLLGDVVAAVADADDLPELIELIASSIKSVLPRHQWAALRLALREPANRLRVFSLTGRPIGSYWRNVYSGALTAGHELGVQLVLVDDAGSFAQQEQAIDSAIAHGMQGIALAPLDPVALEPAMQRARDAGIALVTLDTPPIAESCSLAYIGTDNWQAGKLAGQVLVRLLPAGGPVGVGVEALQAGNVIERLAGLAAAVEGYSLELLPPLDDQHDSERSVRLAQALVHTRSDLAAAVGLCAGNGPAWGLAAETAGKAGQLPIISFDLTPETIEQLKSGAVQAVVAQREYSMGYVSIQVLASVVAFGSVAALARLPASRTIDTGLDVVTLAPTAWSIGLADYLLRPPPIAFRDGDARHKLSRRQEPVRFMLIGMAAQGGEGSSEQFVPLLADSLAAQLLDAAQPLVVDPQAAPYAELADVVEARLRGARLIVAVPLVAASGVLGLLLLESNHAASLDSSDLGLLEQTARTAAVAIENLRLVGQLRGRTHELEQAYERQSLLIQTINELSSPVVPIARGVLVVPLVGTVDSRRAAQIIETVLHAICARQARILLIDISGVPLVDTQVASALIGVTQAARLLGTEVVLVGITPAVAQTIVHLGVDLSSLTTRADLERGFSYALKRVGGRIRYG